MVTHAMHVLQHVDLELDSEKQLLVLHRLIVFVLKMYVLVKMVLKQLKPLVLLTIATSARRVIMVIILVVRRVLPMMARVAMGI